VRIALAAARPHPELRPDTDLPLLVAALGHAGGQATVAHWDDPAVDWSGFDLVVIRSVWDYSWRVAEFLSWLDLVSTSVRVVNGPETVRWNLDKRYLAALPVPVVPSTFVAPGMRFDPPPGEYVVKPAVGAGSRLVARYGPGAAELAAEHVARIHAGGVSALVQPYQHRIDTGGERALVYAGGHFLHAVRKDAVLRRGLRYDERRDGHPAARPWEASPAELALAEAALAAAPPWTYARVDLIDGPVLTELELFEPGLYLAVHPDSAPAVAAALLASADG